MAAISQGGTFATTGWSLDFCFNNSMILLAFIVVLIVTAISLLILLRDLVVWFARRSRRMPPADLPLGDEERQTDEEKKE
jgi:hypothetical protein